MAALTNQVHQGDCREVIKEWPDNFIQCVVTSPPYFGLRDYGVDGQIGLESTPDEYVQKMVEVFREVRRVLRDDGTVWLNLGISYAGSGGAHKEHHRNPGISKSFERDGYSGGKSANHSPQQQHVPACDSDDKESQGCQDHGCACHGRYDERSTEIPTRHGRTAHNGQCAGQDLQPFSPIAHDSEHSDYDQEPPSSSHRAFPESKHLSFFDESFLNASNQPHASGDQQESQTSSFCVQGSAYKKACSSGTSQIVPPLAVRTVGKESFFSACHSPDCKGIGKCGLCWCSLAIPSLNVKPKDEINIPHLVAMALQADGWVLRQTICWHKPNPMPESVKDRCTKAHEYLFLLSKRDRYYFDAEAIADPVQPDSVARYGRGRSNSHKWADGGTIAKTFVHMKRSGNKARKQRPDSPDSHNGAQAGSVPWEGSTRNKRSVWTIATKPFPEAHFATFPPKLIEPCILAGTRKGDIVFDPFMGSGTTAAVAIEHGRAFIGNELNPDYIEISERRIAEAYRKAALPKQMELF